MRSLFVLYALSGFVSLGYQVAWFRFFVDAFGSTNLTFGFVLVQFLGGLGAGSLMSRAVAARAASSLRTPDPLRLYGIVEVAIAASAALTLLVPLLPGALGGAFPYVLDGVVNRPAAAGQWLLLAASAVCVFVPCFLMGVTFPLLCRAFQHDGRFPSALYAWNTLGAATGVLASEFVLLPWLGHATMHLVLVGGNALLGVWFWTGRVSVPTPRVEPVTARQAPTAAGEPTPAVLFAVAASSGLVAGAFEADVLCRVQFFDCRSGASLSCVSFWAIVAIFLASAVVRRAKWLRLRHLQIALAAACGLYLLAWQSGYPLSEWANRADALRMMAVDRVFFPFTNGLAALLWFTGLFVFPAFFLLSLLLPYACNRAQASGRHLGRLYGINMLAFCVGVVCFTVVVPRGNHFYAMRLFLALFVLAAVAFALLRTADRHVGWKAAGSALVAVLLAVFTPTAFAADWFAPGSPPAVHPVRALRSNGAHTTFVVAEPEGDVLWFGSHRMTGSNATAQQYMRLMAHFPLLAHPQPRSALLICFGAGMTASAIAAHRTIDHLDIVDLNDQVFATAPEFAAANKNVIADPRVRLVNDDGRHFLRSTAGMYELITSEPPPPLCPGVDRLYSTEYYREARAHLTPGGLMSQWLPIDQMPLPAMRAAIASFVQVFPDCLLFVGAYTNYILVGCNGPLHLPTVETRFAAEPAVRADLLPFDVRTPRDLFVRITHSARQLQQEFAALAGVRDQHNAFAHAFHDPEKPPVLPFDPVGMLAGLRDAGGDQLICRDELARSSLHLGRLKSLVQDFPQAALASVRSIASGPVAMADVDWRLVERRTGAAAQALAARRSDEAVTHLEAVLVAAPQYVVAARQLGMLHLAARRAGPALAAWRAVVVADPFDVTGHAGVVAALLQGGRPAEALAAVGEALLRFPRDAMLHRLRGDALATMERWVEAVQAYDEALRLAPGDQEATAARARCRERMR